LDVFNTPSKISRSPGPANYEKVRIQEIGEATIGGLFPKMIKPEIFPINSNPGVG
jgi:hypothetical protein